MRQASAIEVHGKLFRFPGVLCQTDNGILLCFQKDSYKWQGVYPGYSWDAFYNDLVIMNIELITPAVMEKRLMEPLFIWPFKDAGICQRPTCNEATSSKYCSVDCWYYDTIEMIRYAIAHASTLAIVDANIKYMERLVAKFGSLVQVGSDSESASQLIVGLLPVSPLDL